MREPTPRFPTLPLRPLHAVLAALVAAIGLVAGPAASLNVPLLDDQVIVDSFPFASVGAEDALGGGKFALNHPEFIDVPYAIFDFTTISDTTNVELEWNFDRLFGGSQPAEITLYLGSDDDGVITVDDRFVGTAIDTRTYTDLTTNRIDVSAIVNDLLSDGPFIAARLEATAAPGTLSDYYGGRFFEPTMTTLPEPGTALLFVMGALTLQLGGRRSPPG